MIGAIGEVLGAAGVILTLAYLSRQIRHNTMAARHAALRETLDLSERWLSQLSKDPQVARLFRRGLEADPELTEDDTLQLRAFFLQLFYLWERQFRYAKDEEFGGEALASYERARAQLLGAPGLQKFFELRGHWFDDDFRAVIEAEMAESQPWGLTVRGPAPSSSEP